MRTPRALSGLCCMLLAGCDEFSQVSDSGLGAFEPSLVATADGLAVAWNDNRDGNDEIYLRLLDAALAPRSEELRLTQSPALSYEAMLVALDDKFALAWYDRDAAGNLAVMLGLWDKQGAALGQMTVSAAERNGRIPVLQVVGDRVFIAWIEDEPPTADGTRANSSLWGQWLDSDGKTLAPPFIIGAASATTWNLNAAALDDGRVALVYDAAIETNASELYLALVDAGSAQITRLSADDGFESKYPDIAIGTAGSALTWFDTKDGNEEVYLSLFDPLAASQDIETQGRRITETAGESVGAYVAWNGARLGLAWNDNDSGQHEIHFQSFNADGEPFTAAQRLTNTEAQSLIPSIAAHGDGFALAWNEVVLSSGGHDGDIGATRSEIVVAAVE